MAPIGRSKLSVSRQDLRPEGRRALNIPARCQIGAREMEDVSITAIDSEQCSVWTVALGVTKSEPVVLYLDGEEPIAGQIQWIRHGSLGVAFHAPLGEAVVERLRMLEAPTNVIALRKGLAR
jgi:hypothetical protein